MTPLFLSAFFQNTGLTIVLVGLIFYLIDRFEATLFELGLLSGIGAFAFMVGAKSSAFFSRFFSPKALTLFGTSLFIVVCSSFPFLPTLSLFFWLYPVGSLALSLFWPSLENWIVMESKPGGALRKNVGFFNLSWSPGQIIAPFLAGFLFEKGSLLPIWIGMSFTLPVFFLLASFPLRGVPKRDRAPLPPPVPPGKFLVACWLSNFAGWFIAAIFRSLFPKYGYALGLSPTVIGTFLLLIGVGQVLFFFLLGHFEKLEHTPRFLFLWETAGHFRTSFHRFDLPAASLGHLFFPFWLFCGGGLFFKPSFESKGKGAAWRRVQFP